MASASADASADASAGAASTTQEPYVVTLTNPLPLSPWADQTPIVLFDTTTLSVQQMTNGSGTILNVIIWANQPIDTMLYPIALSIPDAKYGRIYIIFPLGLAEGYCAMIHNVVSDCGYDNLTPLEIGGVRYIEIPDLFPYMYEDDGTLTNPVPPVCPFPHLENFTVSAILDMLVYLQLHYGEEIPVLRDRDDIRAYNTNDISRKDATFIPFIETEAHNARCLMLLVLANYIDSPHLLDITSKRIGGKHKSLTADQLREFYGVNRPFTEDEWLQTFKAYPHLIPEGMSAENCANLAFKGLPVAASSLKNETACATSGATATSASASADAGPAYAAASADDAGSDPDYMEVD